MYWLRDLAPLAGRALSVTEQHIGNWSALSGILSRTPTALGGFANTGPIARSNPTLNPKRNVAQRTNSVTTYVRPVIAPTDTPERCFLTRVAPDPPATGLATSRGVVAEAACAAPSAPGQAPPEPSAPWAPYSAGRARRVPDVPQGDTSPPSGPNERDAEAAALWRRIALLIAVAAGFRAVLSMLVPLLPDETYYWLWSREIEGGYFDHPPGIAMLIRLGTALFGDTSAGVRAGPWLTAALTHLTCVLTAWQFAGRGLEGARAAWRMALLVAVAPLVALGLVLATPDAVLFVSAMVAVLAVERALASRTRSGRSLGWWTLAGLALGAAFVAKYTAVLLPAGLVLAFLVHPALRVRFREPGPWLASGIALAMFAPVVMWNYANDWISFRFQLGHGFGSGAAGTVLGRELELVGGQIGLISPILYVLLTLTVWNAVRDGWRERATAAPTDRTVRAFALAVVSAVPVVFFAISALRRSVEPNWPALMYPSAFLLLAADPRPLVRGVWWRRGVGLAVVLLLLASLQVWRPLAPVAPRRDPIARAHGWDTLAEAVDAARRDRFWQGTAKVWLAADRYQEASSMTFHLSDHPVVFSLNLNGRTNQYDLWDTAYDTIRPGDGLVAVFDDNPAGDATAARVGRWFGETRAGAHVVLKRGDGAVAHRRIWMYRTATDVPPRRPLPSPVVTRTAPTAGMEPLSARGATR